MELDSFATSPQFTLWNLLPGLVCGVLPAVIAIIRKRWMLVPLSFVLCEAAAYSGGWIAAAPIAIFFAVFVWLAPSDGVALMALGVLLLFSSLLLYALEVRAPALFAKTGLPSLVKIFPPPPQRETGNRKKENEFRKFTAKDGRIIFAKVLETDRETVTIEREDGQVFTTSISVYSLADQVMIRNYR